ncbi:hypothetical protein, partial [Glaesserella parasuis]|uniref:hypothetical protein n=1 Tax=Glaesserella parasuis TaxID=738 RepID=UPI003F29FA56
KEIDFYFFNQSHIGIVNRKLMVIADIFMNQHIPANLSYNLETKRAGVVSVGVGNNYFLSFDAAA